MTRSAPISTDPPPFTRRNAGQPRRPLGTLPPVRPGRMPGSRGQSDEYRINRNLTKEPRPAGHWLWAGAVNGGGYPIIATWNRRVVYVSRLLYETEYGEPPGRLYSTCGVQRCVKPDHRLPKA